MSLPDSHKLDAERTMELLMTKLAVGGLFVLENAPHSLAFDAAAGVMKAFQRSGKEPLAIISSKDAKDIRAGMFRETKQRGSWG